MSEVRTNRYWVTTFLKILLGVVAFIVIAGGGLFYLGTKSRLSSALIKDTTCAPPCWAGITLGHTSPDEAYTLLKNLVWVNADSVEIDQPGDQVEKIVWKFKRPAGDAMGVIYFSNDHPIAQSFLTTGSLTLDQAFKLLGEPQLIGSQVNLDRLEIILLYPTQGFFISLSPELPAANKEQVVELTEKTPVMQVSYFDPAQLDQLFAPQYLLNGLPNFKLADLHPWAGYGEMNFSK